MAEEDIHWSSDDWKTCRDTTTEDSGLGIYIADLPGTELLSENEQIRFTFHWSQADHWEGVDFVVPVSGGSK